MHGPTIISRRKGTMERNFANVVEIGARPTNTRVLLELVIDEVVPFYKLVVIVDLIDIMPR